MALPIKKLKIIVLIIILASLAFVSCKKDKKDEKSKIPSSEWVSIQGVKWAIRNVDSPGTFVLKPKDAGMFYQWNRKIGWSSKDPLVNNDGGTTWDDNIPTGSSWVNANSPCPPGWRLPTKTEFESLVSSGSTWTDDYDGVSGRIFRNGDQELFFPAANFRYGGNGSLSSSGYFGYYWSGSYFNSGNASYLSFSSSSANIPYIVRSAGLSVRCVVE